MGKIVLSVIVIILIVLFISFNLDNTSDISFVFFTVENIPIYLTIFISLLIGALCMIPVVFGFQRKKKKTPSIENLEQEINSTFEEKFSSEQNGKKKKKKGKKASKSSGLDIAPPE